MNYDGKYWTCDKNSKEKYNSCIVTSTPTSQGPIDITNYKKVYDDFEQCQKTCPLKELPMDKYDYYEYDKSSDSCVKTLNKTPFPYSKASKPPKNMYCGQDIPKDDKSTILSSTTNFGFGADTACVCNGDKLSERLAKLGWVGTATPDWMLTPFLQRGNHATANGKATPEDSLGKPYYSNCAVGKGGCGKCWKLEV